MQARGWPHEASLTAALTRMGLRGSHRRLWFSSRRIGGACEQIYVIITSLSIGSITSYR